MKRSTWLAMMLVAALSFPVLAGDKTDAKSAHKDGKDYAKCTEDAQTCLDHMAAKLKNRGWLGIEMDDEQGPGAIKVTRVISGSPAEAAGFKQGDVLVSVNGARFSDNTDEKQVTYEKTKDVWVPGGKVQYVVMRDGHETTLNATLAALPSDVMAQWIGHHMLEHAHPESVAKN